MAGDGVDQGGWRKRGDWRDPNGDYGPPITNFYDLLIWFRMRALSHRILTPGGDDNG